MKKITPETRVKFLGILSDRDYRGVELKSKLFQIFRMSNQTYNDARNELLRNGEIEKIIVKSQGKNYLYRITNKGKHWLENFKLTGSQSVQDNRIQHRYPFLFSFDKQNPSCSIELESYSNLGRQPHDGPSFPIFAMSKELNGMLEDLIHSSNELRKEGEIRDIDAGINIRIHGNYSNDLFNIHYLITELESIEAKWFLERDVLFEMLYKKAIKNKQTSELLCAIDYFCSRPEAILECYFCSCYIINESDNTRYDKNVRESILERKPVYSKDINLKYAGRDSLKNYESIYTFAKYKWPLLDKNLKEHILSLWKERMKKNIKNLSNPIINVILNMSHLITPHYPPYKPDFSLKIGRKTHDFSNSKSLNTFKELFKKPEVLNWLKNVLPRYRSEIWNVDAYHLSPWMFLLELSDEHPTLRGGPHFPYLIDGHAKYDYHQKSVHHIIVDLFAQYPNIIITPLKYILEEFQKIQNHTFDHTWMKVWEEYRKHSRRENHHEKLLLFNVFEKLYHQWVVQGKLKVKTQYVNEIILLYLQNLKHRKSEHTMGQIRKNNLIKQINEKINSIEFKI